MTIPKEKTSDLMVADSFFKTSGAALKFVNHLNLHIITIELELMMLLICIHLSLLITQNQRFYIDNFHQQAKPDHILQMQIQIIKYQDISSC